MTIEEEWLFRKRAEMQSRYGAGTFVALFDWAVIEWGDDAAAVRQRAEDKIGDTVFVGAVPAESADDYYAVPNYYDKWKAYRARFESAGDKRRFRLGSSPNADPWRAIAELDITGQKTEGRDGVVVIDGVERATPITIIGFWLNMASSRRTPSLSPVLFFGRGERRRRTRGCSTRPSRYGERSPSDNRKRSTMADGALRVPPGERAPLIPRVIDAGSENVSVEGMETFDAHLDRGIADADAGRTRPFNGALLDEHIARSQERKRLQDADSTCDGSEFTL